MLVAVTFLCYSNWTLDNWGKEGCGNTVVGADGAALIVGNNWVGAVGCVLADDLVAHDCAAVAHTDLAWLWFPYVPVRKHLAV